MNINVDKNINNTVWVGGQFADFATGIEADPTSASVEIWAVNNATQVITGQALTKFDSQTGYYGYAWDITSVAAGLYQYRITWVAGGNNYPEAGFINIYDKLDQYVSLAGSGNGSIPWTLIIKDVNGVKDENVQVTIYSDSAMSNAISEPLYTNTDGKVFLNLSAGTYYAKAVKANQVFSNPLTFTVV